MQEEECESIRVTLEPERAGDVTVTGELRAANVRF